MKKKLAGVFAVGKKRVIIAVIVIAVIVAGLIFGGRMIYNKFHGGAVNVYSLTDVGMVGDNFFYEEGADAYLNTTSLQTESLSDTQTVSNIYVKKGQKVKKGDKLFSYDSTLEEIELQRKDISIQKLQIELTKEKKILQTMRTYKAGVPVKQVDVSEPDYSSDDDEGDSNTTVQSSKTVVYEGLELLEGSGTKEDPYCYEWSSDFQFTDSFITTATQGQDDAYVQFFLTGKNWDWGDEYNSEADENITVDDSGAENPNADEGADYAASWTMQFRKNSSGRWRYALISVQTGGLTRDISAGLPKQNDNGNNDNNNNNNDNNNNGNDDNNDDNNNDDEYVTYTAAEIAKLIADQEAAIASTELEIRSAKLDYRKAEQELSDSVVYSEVDGIVTTLKNPNKVKKGKTFIKVSGSGAEYQVTTTISEWELDTVEKGQKVAVKDNYTDETYEGTITKISRYPKTDTYYSDESDDASRYPITISMDSELDIDVNDYWLTVNLDDSTSDDSESSSDTIYIYNAFYRTEGNESYVYVLGNDGKLEKRTVTIGEGLYGTWHEITSGLSADDKIAFPYGNNVREGAQTKDGSVDELYGY